MKRALVVSVVVLFAATVAWASQPVVTFAPSSMEGVDVPILTRIYSRGTNVLVDARIPAGFSKVTLEGCARIGGEAWTPKAVARVQKQGGTLLIELEGSPGIELLRLRGDAEEVLPDIFFQGPSSFGGQPVNIVGEGGTLAVVGGGGGVFDMKSWSGGVPTRSVVESDIWKLNGDTLYFFNQYRGLQVIDVREPDTPVLTGTLSLAAAGEQMYVLGDTHVVLLARDSCNWYWGMSASSEVLVIDVQTGKPATVASIPIAGNIIESRLVGTALYVAAQVYRMTNSASSGDYWEAGLEVSSLDLAEPEHPVARSTEWVPNGYNGVVSATERFLFLAKENPTNWWRSDVQIFDISAPDGTMRMVSRIQAVGRVKDKFGINIAGDVLAVISEQGNATYVETFTLADESRPQKVGSLKVVEGESLFATRFDSNRLYAVTFRRIDPLWIIDLSNPAQPHISGELQVPGFSTYLCPLGERLVAIGRETTNQSSLTTVSLFDVKEAGAPALLKRVALGRQYSYSEANYDEKAFAVLPDYGLILVPFSTWSTNGSLQGVQLIDLSRDTLELRGVIEHDVQPRRATVHRERILSLSGRELLTVDATDRDHPTVRATTLLSWSVDQVFVVEPFLLELTGSPDNSSGPVVRVVRLDATDSPVNQLILTNLPFLGAALQSNRMYIAQARSPVMNSYWDTTNQTTVITNVEPGILSLTVVDVSGLPSLTVLGQTQEAITNYAWGDWQALWPKPGLLVWQNNSSAYYPIYWGDWLGGGGLVRGGWGWGPWWGWSGPKRLVAFDVSEDTAPKLISDLTLTSTNSWGGFAHAFAVDGLVYSSHGEYETIITGTNRSVVTNLVSELTTNIVTVTNITQVPQYTSVTNYETNINLSVRSVVNYPAEAGVWQWPGPARIGILGAGGAYGFVLSPGGSVWGWGDNSDGELGDGSYTSRKEILAAPGFGQVGMVAAGEWHTLGLRTDGTVWGAGYGPLGELGNGKPVFSTNEPPIPYIGSAVPVPALGLSNIVFIAAGARHSLGASADGSVWSWGADWLDPLNPGLVLNYSPVKVPAITDVVRLAAGYDHSLAVKRDGAVWAWGRNDYGQLGNGRFEIGSAPVAVTGLAGSVGVSAGFRYSLAVNSDGTVWGWGNNQFGLLGDGAPDRAALPVQVGGLERIVAVSAGHDHGLALKADGSVWAWGANDYGQLGDGTLSNRRVPVQVPDVTNAVAVAAGRSFSLALSADGSLVAWGRSDHGQLGNGVEHIYTNETVRTNISVQVTYITTTNVTQQTRIQYVTRTVLVTNEWPIYAQLRHDYLDVVDYAVPANPGVRPLVEIPGALQGIAYRGALLYTMGWRAVSSDNQHSEQWLDASAYDGVEVFLVDSLSLSNFWSPPVLVHGPEIHVALPAVDTNSTPTLETWTISTSAKKFAKVGSVPLESTIQKLELFGDLLAAQSGYAIQLFDAHDPAALKSVGESALSGCLWFNLDKADGSLEKGLWLPLGAYGVSSVKPAATPGP